VLGRVVGLDRQEGAGADMQRHEMALMTPSASSFGEQRVGEMQAGGGRGDGALLSRA
jgi:hypothetical protein